MQTIVIDNEFRGLLPPLDKETYRLLEENLLQNGCRDALVLWNDTLIDGYNRYGICMEHDIPFSTVNKEFESREEVLIWIISNQVSRRNLTPLQLSRYRGLHYKADRMIIKNASGKNQYSEVKGQNDPKPKSTASRLASQYRVSPKTINRDVKLADAIEAIGKISPEAQQKILSGEVAINKSKLEALLSGSEEEIEVVVAEIEGGTYKRREPSTPAPAESGEPVDGTIAEKRELEKMINTIAKDLCSVLQNPQNSGMSEFKTALRPCIDMLEDVYRRL